MAVRHGFCQADHGRVKPGEPLSFEKTEIETKQATATTIRS